MATADPTAEPVVDLAFPLRGTTIPADHGYSLFAAVSRLIPAFHGDETIGIHPIRGQLVGDRRLALNRTSELVIRLPLSRLPEAIKLAGQRLEIEGSPGVIGVPQTRALAPARSLRSRLVSIRGFLEETSFLEAVRRQLVELAITATVSLPTPRAGRSFEARGPVRSTAIRRTLRIRDRIVVGFAVQVDGLSPDESIRLQARGLGGRRRFGCGILLPITEEANGSVPPSAR